MGCFFRRAASCRAHLISSRARSMVGFPSAWNSQSPTSVASASSGVRSRVSGSEGSAGRAGVWGTRITAVLASRFFSASVFPAILVHFASGSPAAVSSWPCEAHVPE